MPTTTTTSQPMETAAAPLPELKKQKSTQEASFDPNQVLQIKKLSENATIPKRGSDGAAGYDLYR